MGVIKKETVKFRLIIGVSFKKFKKIINMLMQLIMTIQSYMKSQKRDNKSRLILGNQSEKLSIILAENQDQHLVILKNPMKIQ